METNGELFKEPVEELMMAAHIHVLTLISVCSRFSVLVQMFG